MPFSQWLYYTQSNLFKEHDGFYELPYLSNNPRLMVDSFAALTIASHNKTEQVLSSDNAYFKGEQHYIEIEEGLWLLATDFNFKKNILCNAIYDDTVLSDYYFLSFAVFDYQYPVNNDFTEFTHIISTTCTFYKPGTQVNTFFYEGTQGKVFNIAFTRKWALAQFFFKKYNEEGLAKAYLNGETGFMNWLDIVPDAENLAKKMWDYVKDIKDRTEKSAYLVTTVKRVVNDFFSSTLFKNRIVGKEKLINPDFASIAKAEKLILMNLKAPFLGVDAISKSVHVSSTKLKIIFKAVFGFSMLQYHKEKNMLLALQLIKNSTMQIRNIALLTGYESASKFTAAFKKRFGFLPSEKRTN
jgi:AraC-like DNA-binding protein